MTLRSARAFPNDTPPAGQDSVDVLMDELFAVLAEHHDSLPRPAWVKLHVLDRPEANRCFTLGQAMTCSRLDAPMDPRTAVITTTLAVLEHMLRHPTTFDPRSAEIAALGGICIDGAQRIAAYWFQLLKRPPPEVSAALERAGARKHSMPREVPSIDAAVTPDWPRRVFASILEGRPLTVRAAIDWPEVRWTLAEWRERDGAAGLRGDPRTGRAQLLKDVIDASDEAAVPQFMGINYTGGSALPSAWESRFRLPRLPASLFSAAQLWFGKLSGETLVTNLHCDAKHSFLAQVHGTKRVRLFPPQEAGNVYALDVFNTFRPCRVDVDKPDLHRFPRFEQARCVDVTIHEGDLLVIPTGWFHCVWASGVTMSISRFASDTAIESDSKAIQCAVSTPMEGVA